MKQILALGPKYDFSYLKSLVELGQPAKSGSRFILLSYVTASKPNWVEHYLVNLSACLILLDLKCFHVNARCREFIIHHCYLNWPRVAKVAYDAMEQDFISRMIGQDQ